MAPHHFLRTRTERGGCAAALPTASLPLPPLVDARWAEAIIEPRRVQWALCLIITAGRFRFTRVVARLLRLNDSWHASRPVPATQCVRGVVPMGTGCVTYTSTSWACSGSTSQSSAYRSSNPPFSWSQYTPSVHSTMPLLSCLSHGLGQSRQSSNKYSCHTSHMSNGPLQFPARMPLVPTVRCVVWVRK